MSLDSVDRTMRAYLQELRARGDYGRFFANDISFDVLWSDTSAQGPAEVEQVIRFLHEVAFDARPQVLRLVVGEDGAAAEFAFSGTHIGEFRGIPATGKSVRVAYSAFYEVRDGKITDLRVYLPVERLVEQLRAGAPEGEPPGEGKSYEDWLPDEDLGDDEFGDEEPEEGLEEGGVTPGAPRRAATVTMADAGRSGSLRRMLRAVVRRSARGGSRSTRSAAR